MIDMKRSFKYLLLILVLPFHFSPHTNAQTPIPSVKVTISGLTITEEITNVTITFTLDENSYSRYLPLIPENEEIKTVIENLRINHTTNSWYLNLTGIVDSVSTTFFWAKGEINFQEPTPMITLFGFDYRTDIISINAEDPIISFSSVRTTGQINFKLKMNLNKSTPYTSVLAIDLDDDGHFNEMETTRNEGSIENSTLTINSTSFTSYMPLVKFALNFSLEGKMVCELIGSINFTSGNLVNIESGQKFNYSLIPTISFTPLLSNSILKVEIPKQAFTTGWNGLSTTTPIKPIHIIVTVDEEGISNSLMGENVENGSGNEQLTISEFVSRLNPMSLILFLSLVLGIPAFSVTFLFLRAWMYKIKRRKAEGIKL